MDSHINQPDPQLFIKLMAILNTHLTEDTDPDKFFLVKDGVKIIL